MKALEEKIIKDGTCIGTEIIKVDNFLNHQIDVKFLDEIGKEIANLFEEKHPTKILTVEASGIAIAIAASRFLGSIPVVFAKKSVPSTMVDGMYVEDARSFTKGTVSSLRVSKKYLGPEDKVLIVDDFLASGEAGVALCNIVKQAGAEVIGFTAAIEKEAQGGEERLSKMGVDVKCLAVVKSMTDGKIVFK